MKLSFSEAKSDNEKTVLFLDIRIPRTFQSITSNGLAYFLLSNVLTGVINIIINTLEVSSCPAVIIIAMYTFLLCIVAELIQKRNIKLKFW